ncbi:MAG: hypothetical protein HY785_13930 [Oscillatoriophycideae cyanobacterium NC_groundwater_1537_Pr4_S-0.65um_50_18]|nr:hypothetical protein [Oscillatoriophycideae cyanobacterium NC_groundwater_1537_Pr4_S-0.65um_50_18]
MTIINRCKTLPDGAIAQDWTDLLKSVGLENLATQSLIR